eukprot:GHVP01069578.1.p1 GENE.GHVP01069578.1~~GHVP01069578.1.p1  ORF type:complete len:354 (+),score=54.71 GHVP01069578.1:1407-2468(+)
MEKESIENVVIIGGGPAGNTAAIYTSRAGLNPILFEGLFAGGVPAGGQLTTTTHVENYPGFPEGIDGNELMIRMRDQSLRFGTKIFTETVTEVTEMDEVNDNSKESSTNNTKTDKDNTKTDEENIINNPTRSRYFCVKTKKRSILTRTVIIATGSTAKRMNIPGTLDNEFWNKGVSACATCDGALPLFKNGIVFVVGGGDTAMEEAIFLTRFVEKVYILHRRDELRASKIMQERAKSNNKIEILYSSTLIEVRGSAKVDEVIIMDLKSNQRKDMRANGVFFAIGHTPNTGFLPKELDKDSNGYVNTEQGSTKTSIDGIFCCGDAHDKRYRQAITAAGTGCMSALEVEHYLSFN